MYFDSGGDCRAAYQIIKACGFNWNFADNPLALSSVLLWEPCGVHRAWGRGELGPFRILLGRQGCGSPALAGEAEQARAPRL